MMQLSNISKIHIVLLSLVMCAMLGAAWMPFNPGDAMRGAETNIVFQSDFSIIMDIKIFGLTAEEINTEEMINTQHEVFMSISLPNEYHTGEIGRPSMPAIKKTIGVPIGAQISLEIINAKYRDIPLEFFGIDKRIMPVLAPVEKIPGKEPVFELDDKLYGQDKFYPVSVARIENEDLMRGHRLVVLEIAPIQYNPITNILRCYTEFEVRVRFAGGDMIQTKDRILRDYSPLFEDFIKRRVSNYGMYENIMRGVLPLPIHYLIITHNSFQTQVNDLASWLKQKGFKVKVANQDSITSWTISGIETYIDAQNPLPTYLLLVGDVNGGYMPAPIGSAPMNTKVTDLYYAETDGSGYLPDMLYGRLSVETTTHITTIVEKILKYEKAQLPDMASWFKKDAFLAGNDNYSITEGTHNYCTTNFMDPNGYTTYKLYEQTYGATTADVFTNVNEGRILTTMSGHGSDDGWYDGPPFQVTHVNQLTNGDKLTIATGHCCLANNFGWSSGPCGGESWIRKANGGAVAYYGSCPSTYWSEDDWLQREWYEAIYVDSMYEHARFTLDGMYDGIYLSSTSLKQYYYEGYHVLGDPALDLWTDVPVNMVVTHDVAVIPSASDFTVSVTGNGSPLEDALVCAWIPNQSPEMHIAEYTNAAGIATLGISPTTPGDTMYVTVTKHNFIPYENHALVIAASGPYILAGSIIINDGNNNQANPGDTVQLGVWARNIGAATANAVYGLLATSDPYVSLMVDSSFYSSIPVGDSAISAPYYQFTIANDCPNNHSISFDLEFHDDLDSVWVSHPSVTVYAPAVVYQRYQVLDASGALEPGETVDLAVTLANEGAIPAENVTATITTDDVYLTILTDTASYGGILPDSAVTCLTPYVVEADSSTPVPHVAQVVMSIAGTGYAAVDTFGVLIGNIGFYDTVEDTMVTNQYTVQGQWHRTQHRNHSPSYAWWNGTEGTWQYSNNVDASIITPSITLGDNSEFECWNWYSLESNYDYGYIELSTDNGTTWSQLTSFNGNSGNWVRYSTTLNYPVGTQVKIRFRLDTDGSVVREGWYVDDIRVFDPLGVTEVTGLVATEVSEFFRISPNPFKRVSAISYQLARASQVALSVYDVSGRLVKVLSAGQELIEPGYYTVSWDGSDEQGRAVPAGVYFVKFESADHASVQKAILLR